MNFRDVELLSAYLDGRLNPSDAARLERRLSSDPGLKATLEDLRETRGLLRRLPQRRAPRNFRLTPKMAGIKPPEARAYPAFRFATAMAALLFVAAVALNAITPFAASRLAAPAAAPAYGMGGGSGGGSGGAPESVPPQAPAAGPAATAAPAATEAPLQSLVMPTPTVESPQALVQATVAAEDTARASKTAATEEANQAAPMMQSAPAPEAPRSPVPLPWVLGLGGVMLACAAGAWAVRRSNDRRIRERWKQK